MKDQVQALPLKLDQGECHVAQFHHQLAVVERAIGKLGVFGTFANHGVAGVYN